MFFVHAESGVHRLAPECKLVATVLFVFAVVATPREAVWAFALDALIIVGIAIAAHVPLGRLARRLVIELPFLAFAVFCRSSGGARMSRSASCRCPHRDCGAPGTSW